MNRSHATFLSAWSKLSECMPIKQVFHFFMPVLVERMREAAVEVVRISAQTLVALMNASQYQKHQGRVCSAAKKLGSSRKWNHRMAFLYFCDSVLKTCSRRFFKTSFFRLYLGILQDPVPNVRVKAVRLLPNARKSLELPQDEALLDQLKEKLDGLLDDPDNDVKMAFEGVGGVSVGFGKPAKKEELEEDRIKEKRENERITTDDQDISDDEVGGTEDVYIDRETEAQNNEIDTAMEEFKAEQERKKKEQESRLIKKKKEDAAAARGKKAEPEKKKQTVDSDSDGEEVLPCHLGMP